MILTKLIAYLGQQLNQGAENDIYVGVEAPAELSGYVLIDQTGSATQNHITTTTIAVQSYGESLLAAYELNETVKSAMLNFIEDNEITSVKLETDYNFTNAATKQYRWQAVYEITHYLGGN